MSEKASEKKDDTVFYENFLSHQYPADESNPCPGYRPVAHGHCPLRDYTPTLWPLPDLTRFPQQYRDCAKA